MTQRGVAQERPTDKFHLAVRFLATVRRKNWAVHLGLGLLLPLTEAFLLLSWIVLPQGYVFYGDATPILNPWTTLNTAFSVRNFQSSLGTSSTFIWLPFVFLYWLVSLVTGAGSTSRFVVVIFAALPGCSMYVGASCLTRSWLKDRITSSETLLFSAMASQVYLLSFANNGLWNIFTPWTFSYAILPLFLAGFWLWIFEARIWGLIILSSATVLSSMNPFWIEEVLLLAGPAFLAYLPQLWKKVGGRVTVARVLAAFGAIGAANFYWVLPLLFQYQVGTASYSPAHVSLSFEGMVSASRGYGLLDVLLYGHSSYDLFGEWQRNWSILSLLPAVATYLPILLRKEPRKLILGLSVSLLIGLFLAKGANPPLGIVFYEVAIRLPLGFGVYFRNGGSIFLEQVLAVAALLIGFAAVDLARAARTVGPNEKRGTVRGACRESLVNPSRSSSWNYFVKFSHYRQPLAILLPMILALLVPLVTGAVIDQSVYGPRFVATEIPLSYLSTNSFLQQQPGQFNVLWIPNGCCDVPYWKPPQSILTDFPAVISSRSVLPDPAEQYLAYVHVPRSKVVSNWMALLGTRYVIVHSDFLGYPWEPLNRSLDATPDISLAFRAGFVSVYEVREPWSPQRIYLLPPVQNYFDGFAQFDGTQSIEASHNGITGTTLNFLSGQDFTLSAWAKTNTAGTQIIAQNNVYGGTWSGWVLGLWQSRPWFQAGQIGSSKFQGLVANMSIADGDWHLITGERYGTSWRLFVDGRLAAERSNMISFPIETDQNASIGARVTTHGDNTWFFDGSLANIQLYSRALNETEIGGVYSLGLKVTSNAIAGYAPLLWALKFNDTLISPQDLSGSGFRLIPSGTLKFGETHLPLDVSQSLPRNVQIVSSIEESATDWKAQLIGQGQVTLVLAEPFAPGWKASWSGHAVEGFPLFGGVVTAFNLTLGGQTFISLHYVYEDALVFGTLLSLFGFPVLILAVWLKKRAFEGNG